MLEQHLVLLLMKLAVAASLASIMGRSTAFQRMLLREERNFAQRFRLAMLFAFIFGGGVALRVLTNNDFQWLDLALEGALLAGILGGYFTGLMAGITISLPALIPEGPLAMLLYGGAGVLGGLLRDLAPKPDDIWSFSPYFDITIARFFRRKYDVHVTLFHGLLLLTLIFAELVRWGLDPLKIWNTIRQEKLLEAQQRLLTEARLRALTSQINPHFLFNTLNTVTALIRTNPEEARTVVRKLSNILRRLLRKEENMSPLREELGFINDYLSIEMVRFGDKLRFVRETAADTLDRLVPTMILQPIIENSIKHGLSTKIEGGVITLRTRLEQERLHIEIEDNGVGVPESKLATMFDSGIGVSNVNERLKVLFGDDYRMDVDSRPGEGTRTHIEFPDLNHRQ